MPPLELLIAEQKAEILHAWTDLVRDTIDAPPATRFELTDHVPAFLDEICAALRGRSSPSESPSALEHGTQRLRLGFDVGAVVREYGLLREVIVAAAKNAKIEVTHAEHAVLFECVVTGIAEAASEYGRQRDAEQHRNATEHFAFIAHELRNPLQSSRTALALLQRTEQLPETRATQVLHRGLTRMHELIDHSLDLARLGTQTALRPEELSLCALIEDAILEATPDAEAKNVEVDVALTGDDIIQADARLLASAVTNILRNAVKFTHADSAVHVRAHAEAGRVRVEVEDCCGGIPADKVDRIFAPFTQLSGAYDGFGLGLAIAKQAIVAHDGNISVKNLPRKGCVFVVELPARTRS